jgi:pantoate--beta-alanine ligase
MKTFRQAGELAAYLSKKRREGLSIGFVPTMGALHRGHVSLAAKARLDNDIAVMSIFVNPAQFGPKEDLKKYPRDIKRDRMIAGEAGVDILFYPSVGLMYPQGYKTYVDVEDITTGLCGSSRPGHFKGVATIVTKLFNIVRPDRAYFGQKDAQQAVVIRKMVKDLDMGIDVKVMPIIREGDGLAMSSRNAYLSADERSDARVLYEALNAARTMVRKGTRDARRIKNAMKRLIKSKRSARIDYISISDLKELKEIKRIKGRALIALAVWIGKTRLIDNIVLGGKL